MSGASSAKVLPRSTGRSERRSGSGESGVFWLQEVCWRQILQRCRSLQDCAAQDRTLSRIFNSNTGKTQWVKNSN